MILDAHAVISLSPLWLKSCVYNELFYNGNYIN